LGRSVSELKATLTLNEFRLWAAFYVLEAEREQPAEQRVRRPATRAAACQELNRLFGVGVPP
jgi:hypothetical protein